MNPHERKHAQEDFRTARQICVATEAAGEGINLQFCRLMINYDLPWNPTRLEQRLGRIHRIGQERDCPRLQLRRRASPRKASRSSRGASFSASGEAGADARGPGRPRLRCHRRSPLAERREPAGDAARGRPRSRAGWTNTSTSIEKVDPQRLLQYEQATGIALARANVDFSGFQRANVEAEERRLMPRYVEDQFVKSCRKSGLKVEPRADGLWRIEHVLADLRSDRLEAVRRLGKPEPAYRKLTFHKEHLDQDQHVDAVLLGPGHPLYAAVDEKVNEKLAALAGGIAVFVDASAQLPYRLHFFEIAIRGQNTKGDNPTSMANSSPSGTNSAVMPHRPVRSRSCRLPARSARPPLAARKRFANRPRPGDGLPQEHLPERTPPALPGGTPPFRPGLPRLSGEVI